MGRKRPRRNGRFISVRDQAEEGEQSQPNENVSTAASNQIDDDGDIAMKVDDGIAKNASITDISSFHLKIQELMMPMLDSIVRSHSIAPKAKRSSIAAIYAILRTCGVDSSKLSKIGDRQICSGPLFTLSAEVKTSCTFYCPPTRKQCDGCNNYLRPLQKIDEESDFSEEFSCSTKIEHVVKEHQSHGKLNASSIHDIRMVDIVGIPLISGHQLCLGVPQSMLSFCREDEVQNFEETTRTVLCSSNESD
jgi:hypothetical protein